MEIIFVITILVGSSLGEILSAKTSEEFINSLKSAAPGDTIQLEPFEYEGSFVLTNNGTAENPITIVGKTEFFKSTVIENKDGPGIALNNVENVIIARLVIKNSNKGISVQESQGFLLKSLIITNVDEEAVIINSGSANGRIESLIVQGAGQGINIGSPSNEETLDQMANITISSTILGDIKKFPIRVHPGVSKGEITSSIIDGNGMIENEDPFESSLVMLSGSDWIIHSNILNDVPLHGFSIKSGNIGGVNWGCKIVFKSNICNLNSEKGVCVYEEDNSTCE